MLCPIILLNANVVPKFEITFSALDDLDVPVYV